MRRRLTAVAVLTAMLGTGALLGVNLGPRFWPVFLALALSGLAAVAWSTHRASGSPPPLHRKGPKRPRGGVEEEYDLEADTSTDEQRWLM
jgi:hypothetical protein